MKNPPNQPHLQHLQLLHKAPPIVHTVRRRQHVQRGQQGAGTSGGQAHDVQVRELPEERRRDEGAVVLAEEEQLVAMETLVVVMETLLVRKAAEDSLVDGF